ncbi:hypothetical protein BGZ98_009892 [Dissophora globulifera]|nr:hypothetical protein BGZ98_009892 [Dissophora globulifera]
MASFGGPISRDNTGTVRRREITLSTREKQLYGQLWAAADKDNSGFITGADAVPFFAKSGLSPQVLGQIWVLADADNKGVLGQQGFSIAVKLIAHAQTGKTPSPALINADAPLPHFEGVTSAKSSDSPALGLSPITAQTTGPEPPLTSEDKTKYSSMFMACGPVSGLLDGDKAREVFLKSKLPVDKLSQIWALADTKQRGSLDITDFTIAMYYIQHTMDGSVKTLPSTLPPSILQACTSSSTGTSLLSSPVMSMQALNRQVTGSNLHNPAVARQLTGSTSLSSSPLTKQTTGGASNLFGSNSADVPWEITPEEKAKFDRFYDQLDKNGTGSVGGEEAGKFFLNSRLPESVLAQIWDLSDITGSGSLSKDEFAVAMLLINRKNATGAPIPKTLPLSLVPPSLRNRVSASLTFPLQEPSRSMTLPSNSAHQQFRRQSFDLLGDGPSLMAAGGSAGTAQPDKDLIGAEDLTSKITSETGELASMQNQINNLSKVTGDLQAKRAILEKNLSALSAQKQDISIRLNQIKTLHENETRSIKDLESALSSIQPQLIKLREELMVSERELSVARTNKDQYLLSLAKDQEESNHIRTRLRQNNEETVKLREEFEAKKKDTGRQKSLLEIARRQLATSDADKQKLISDIAQESEKAAQAVREIQNLPSASSLATAPSSSTTASSGAPPPPAPRGSRKEPPPPPASRGTGSAFSSRVSPEEEDAFGIPEALRSPTGSFHSAHSTRATAPASVSRQSTGSSPFESVGLQATGSSPFEAVSRQGTGSSPFETIPRHATGSSPFEPISPQGTGAGAHNDFLFAAQAGTKGPEDLWSPMTHAANSKFSGPAEVTMSPDPESTGPTQADSLLAQAASEALPNSPPVHQDPFGSVAFPAMDTPPVTKMDFDSAFQGFSVGSKPSQSVSVDSVKSAEAFAEAFPAIDTVSSPNATESKRVSAFGFEDDFSGTSTFTQAHNKGKEDLEFPPIVEMSHVDEDSSDDSDDDNDDAFVQAKSSIASPDATSTPIPRETNEAFGTAPSSSLTDEIPSASASTDVAQPALGLGPSSPAVSSDAAGSLASAPKKLTAADFSEFESSFGGAGDDFDSAFNGVELAPPKVSSKAGDNTSGFDDGFDFNASFDDAFGSSSHLGTSSQAPSATNSGVSAAPASAAFKTADLDEAFGAFGLTGANASSAGANTTTGTDVGSNAFRDGFSDFEAGFSSTASRPVSASTKAIPSAPAAPSGATETKETSTSVPAPPQVRLEGVDELMNMGFTRQQAEDALLRYDTLERAANFLLEGGQL